MTTEKNAANFRNPLGYWCAPNACTPGYAAEDDLRDFIGYAWTQCDFGNGNWELPEATDSDTRWMREYLLRAIEKVAGFDPEDNPAGSMADPDNSGFDVHEEMGFGDDTMVGWTYLGRDVDGQHAFALTCTDSDDDVMWLGSDALSDPAEVARVIAEAREINGIS
jgi:hypothetical protein